MDELRYVCPPDILHYETRYLLGFTVAELLIGGGAALLGMLLAGPLPGLAVGGVALLAIRRWEGFGNRSLPLYLLAILAYRFRRVEVELPRLLPMQEGRLEVYSWDGEKLFELEEV